MADASTPPTKTPWHLWLVAVLAVLWNAMGALDFTMTQMKSEAYLKDFTPGQRAYFFNFPLWAVLGWGMGTWGGFLGSLLTLFRRGFAVNLLAVSLAGIVITDAYSYGLSDWMKVVKGGTGTVIFSAVIFIVGLVLFVYTRAMRRRGVLR